jgi:hypothetical protein
MDKLFHILLGLGCFIVGGAVMYVYVLVADKLPGQK